MSGGGAGGPGQPRGPGGAPPARPGGGAGASASDRTGAGARTVPSAPPVSTAGLSLGAGQPTPPPLVLVMGVSGAGKSTVGRLLAARLGVAFADADEFHPAANIGKMSSGQPLTDEDRWPWLDAIGAWLDARGAAGGGVVTCSALKRAYRDRLVRGRPAVRLLHLHGDPALIAARQAARPGHFMPASLMASQFATLEAPGTEENPITLSVEATPEAIVQAAILALGG
jgi:gluconokinase